ncbi:hypothetical protein [Halorubrum trueperi]|uniref:Uncharacterized protein n=1 Tax=Halorubrum trueperi TaxID=2004704 RepID=A0ABD5UF27_9EURY
MAVEIDRSGTNKWRYRCPRGHTNFEVWGDTIACVSCPMRTIPGSVTYETIIDKKTGRELTVSEVVGA